MTHKLHTSDQGFEDIEWRHTPLPSVLPITTFRTRVRDSSAAGPNPYRWENVSSWDLFAGKQVLLFSLPGAFTPTCDTFQLPDFEKLADEFFYKADIDEIYCVSVNDAFVMNKWAESQSLSAVQVLPDGSADFTEAMTMDVRKDNLGFGVRSWRYAVVADNGIITDWFLEEGKDDNVSEDPYFYTNPNYVLKTLLGEL